MKRRGFTLIEVFWTIAILSILVGLTVVGAGRPSPATSRSLAEVVAGELRAARAQALSQRVPVAVRVHCQGQAVGGQLSVWKGDQQPRWFKTINLASELPGGQLFVGTWTGGATIDRPAQAGEGAFDVQRWFAPQSPPSDPLLVFTPAGTVWSNDLPLQKGTYRWVACTGAEFSASNPPGTATVSPRPALFQLQAVHQPNTILIEPGGSVRVEEGLSDNDTGVALRNCGSPLSAAGAAGSWPTNTTPEVTSMKFSPTAPLSVPPGVTSQVSRDGHVVLTVEARDLDGDELFCEFQSDGGGFTRRGEARMEWDAKRQLWSARWVFRPGPDDAVDHIYNLECRVRDARGTPGVAAAGVQLTATFQLVKADRLVYGKIPYEEIYTMNADGSDRRVIPVMQGIGGPADFPSLSPDGSKILVSNAATLDLWVVNVDGTGARQLVTGRGCYGASWSPDGSKLVVAAQFGGPAHLYLLPSGGELNPPTGGSPLLPPQPLTTAVEAVWGQPEFNAAGTKVIALASPPGSSQVGIYSYDLSSHSGHFVLAPEAWSTNQGFSHPHFCPDPGQSDLIVFDYGDGTNRGIQTIRENGSGRQSVPTPGGQGWVEGPIWSPSGTRLAYLTNRICVSDFSAAGGTLSNEKVLADFAGAFDW